MHNQPNLLNYYRFVNAFTAEECDFLVNSKFNLGPALTENGVKSDLRKSNVFWIPKTAQYDGLHQKVMELVGKCNKEFFNFDISVLHEKLQFTEYDSSYQGHYDWHFDVGGSPVHCGRKLSVSVQLSDPSAYEGGELQFSLDAGRTVVAEKGKGTMIIFPSYLQHRVTPVTKGTRYSLVTWITGPPFR
jgi:PKHD-type hydroxylase